MDRQYIEENLIIERYVLGELSPDELERFEEFCMESKTCFEQLQVAERLAAGLRDLVADEILNNRGSAHDAPNRSDPSTRRALGWLWDLIRAPAAAPVAFGAAALALIAAVWMFGQLNVQKNTNKALTVRLEEAFQPQANTGIFRLSSVRGHTVGPAEPVNIVQTGASPEWVVFAVPLLDPAHETYRITLFDHQGQSISHQDGLKPNHSDELVISMHSSFLDPGDYSLVVEGIASNGTSEPESEATFRVVRKQ